MPIDDEDGDAAMRAAAQVFDAMAGRLREDDADPADETARRGAELRGEPS